MFEKVTKGNKPAETCEPTRPEPKSNLQRKEATTIGASIKLKGDLVGEEDLLIQGQVEGTIQLQNNNLTIGDKGRINADVSAKIINVQGELNGDLNGEDKVTIAETGKVHGNIVAPRVVLEDGAVFKGSIDMEPTKAPSAKQSTGAKPSQSAGSGAPKFGGVTDIGKDSISQKSML